MKMFSSISYSSLIMLLAVLTITEAMSLRGPGAELRCRCIQTEKNRIGRHIERLELIPASSHCRDIEIIATLKQSGHMVCLDPNAPWVQRIINKMLANKKK